MARTRGAADSYPSRPLAQPPPPRPLRLWGRGWSRALRPSLSQGPGEQVAQGVRPQEPSPGLDTPHPRPRVLAPPRATSLRSPPLKEPWPPRRLGDCQSWLCSRWHLRASATHMDLIMAPVCPEWAWHLFQSHCGWLSPPVPSGGRRSHVLPWPAPRSGRRRRCARPWKRRLGQRSSGRSRHRNYSFSQI